MEEKLFAELKESFGQALQHARGERKDLRTTTLPRPPKKLTSVEIAALREKLKFSQAVFAHHLNVSVKTVQAWEQGIGKPNGAALKLLSIAKRNPKVLTEG